MVEDEPGSAVTLAQCCDDLGGTAACAAQFGVEIMLRCCAHYEETRYREQTVLDLMLGADEMSIDSGGHFRILEPSRGECFQQTKAYEATPATLLLHLPGTTSLLRSAVFGHLRAHWCEGDDLLGLPPVLAGAAPSSLVHERAGSTVRAADSHCRGDVGGGAKGE